MKNTECNVIFAYPERSEYSHLVKGKKYYATEKHYGGKNNKGQYLIDGWWHDADCFITMDEHRENQLNKLIC